MFEACTANPGNFLSRAGQAGTVLRAAAARVMRPKVHKQAHEAAFQAVLATAADAEEEGVESARQAVREVFDVDRLELRECLELFAIAGIRKAIPLC